MTETLRLIAPFLGASTLAWVAYYLVKNLRIRPKVGRAPGRLLRFSWKQQANHLPQ